MDPTVERPGAGASISSPTGDRKGDDARVLQLEAALVSRAQRGDRGAFEQIYRRHHGPVARMVAFSLGGGAEDAVAETFVRAWQSLPRYRDRGLPFAAWLYAIARHVVADELARRRRVEPTDEVPVEAAQDRPDDRLDLLRALDRLPKEQRQVIELKYLMGLRNPEVARALGRTTGAVNALQWRALRALRGMVER